MNNDFLLSWPVYLIVMLYNFSINMFLTYFYGN